VNTQTFFGGLPISRDETILLENTPDIVIGTPGRLFELVKTRRLNLHQIKHFIIDECDEIFNNVSTRRTVQQIFVATPQEKQVMMFSATIPCETRLICKKFMNEPFDFSMEDDVKLSLRGLGQYYISTEHSRKTRALLEYIGHWKFDQALIFVANSKKM
jgi:superfamily II DNA/RNA helicase